MGFTREDVDRLKVNHDIEGLLDLILADHEEDRGDCPFKYAAGALRDLNDGWITTTMMERLESGSAGDREGAACVLYLLEDPRAEDVLLAHLEEEGRQTRRSIVEALGGIRSRKAAEPLIRLLKDEAYLIRWSAIRALGNIGDPRALKPLVGALWESKDSLPRNAIILSIAEIGGPEAVAVLEELFELTTRARDIIKEEFGAMLARNVTPGKAGKQDMLREMELLRALLEESLNQAKI